jgi:hypothetical protein
LVHSAVDLGDPRESRGKDAGDTIGEGGGRDSARGARASELDGDHAGCEIGVEKLEITTIVLNAGTHEVNQTRKLYPAGSKFLSREIGSAGGCGCRGRGHAYSTAESEALCLAQQ